MCNRSIFVMTTLILLLIIGISCLVAGILVSNTTHIRSKLKSNPNLVQLVPCDIQSESNHITINGTKISTGCNPAEIVLATKTQTCFSYDNRDYLCRVDIYDAHMNSPQPNTVLFIIGSILVVLASFSIPLQLYRYM